MRFGDWLEQQPRGTTTRILRETGISAHTLWKLSKPDGRLVNFDKAKVLSEWTGGAVSIAELCERAPVAEASSP